jgi:hypothetical protein
MAKRGNGNPPNKRWRAYNTAELVANGEGKRRLRESACRLALTIYAGIS